mgnify:CR=1 FL=1
MNIDSIYKLAEDNSIETVDLKYTNLFGGLHHLTLPIDNLSSELFERGIGIDGSSVPGLKSSEVSSDAVIIPDPLTVVIDPFWETRTLSMLCGIYTAAERAPHPLDSRRIAFKAETFLAETGIANESLWAPEFEFFIFDSIRYLNDINTACYQIDSTEANWKTHDSMLTPALSPNPHNEGYHSAPPRDRFFNLRNNICSHLQSFGIKVKYHHHEAGGPAQSEIETFMEPLVRCGDNSTLIKYTCKMAARAAGKCVTFMPKPLFNEAGNGLHFHQRLVKEGQPVFYDPDGYAGLSRTALYYIGGLLKHGPALLALTNPSTNSYKRLGSGFEAPVRAIFGLGDRTAAVRIPEYASRPDRKRIEFRPPDASCNIYIAMAAQLMAGLDGILNEIDPSEQGFGPFDIDAGRTSTSDRNAVPKLPASLEEAIRSLERDHDFLTAGGVFPHYFFENWIEGKLRKDNEAVIARPHPYEIQLYFDV